MNVIKFENVGVPVSVPDIVAALIVGLVRVLFVKVSVVARATSVSVLPEPGAARFKSPFAPF